MYAVTSEYMEAVNNPNQTTYIAGEITTQDAVIPFNDADIEINTLVVSTRCFDSGDFCIGSVYAAELKLNLLTHIPHDVLDYAKISLRLGLEVDGEFEYVPLGEYTIVQPVRTARGVAIQALDNLILLDESIEGVGTSGTLFALTQYCCNRCGVTFGMTESEFSLLPNSKTHFILPSDTAIETCRDLISCIAGLLGGFATINRVGQLVYKLYNPQSVAVIPANNRTGTGYNDYTVQFNGVQMDVGDSTYIRVDSESNGTTLVLEPNPLLQGRSVEDIELALDNILTVITPIAYVPYKTSYTGNPALDAGDFVTLEGGNIKTSLLSLMSVSEWRYRGMQRLEGQGKNPKLKVKESQSQKRLNQTTAMAQGSKETVYFFENSMREVIKERDEVIIEIQFAPIKKASPMFHASLLIDLETAGTLIFTYIINTTPYAFMPTYTLPVGVSTLTLFFPLNNMTENKLHTFEVCVRSEDATGAIPKLGIQAVVVGQGLGSGESMWDGRIRVSEDVPPISLVSGFTMSYNANPTLSTETPLPNGFTVDFAPIGLGTGFTFGGISEQIETGYVTENARFYFDSAHKAEHTLPCDTQVG